MISGADSDQFDRIIDKYNLMESFTHILKHSAKDLKKEALDVILNVLKTATSEYIESIKEIEGLIGIIGDLASEKDYQKCAVLILKYFDSDLEGSKKEKDGDEDNQEDSERED